MTRVLRAKITEDLNALHGRSDLLAGRALISAGIQFMELKIAWN